MQKIIHLVLALAIILGLGSGIFDQAQAQIAIQTTLVLDGTRDAGYTLLAQDASGDLANPGPGAWSGTLWTDLTNLYVADDGLNLWVYIDLPAYTKAGSSGEIALTIDKDGDSSSSGGAVDPWGSAVSYNYNSLYNNVGQTPQPASVSVHPDFVIRGNLSGMGGNPPDDNNGWTELRTWNGSSWNGSGVNWGGITGSAQVGSKIAYANNQGVEFKIPWADLGLPAGGMVNLQFYALQKGTTRGAYDTLPSDDQSNGWNDPTAQTKLATFGGSIEVPAAPGGVQASDGSFSDKVRITWQVSSGATSYDVYRALTLDGSKTMVGGASAAMLDDTTAAAGTSYYYWVKAKNGAGESDFSTPDSGYRNANPPLDPPAGVQASDGTYTDKVAVTWTAVSGATSYDIYRSDTAGGAKTLLGNATTMAFNDLTGSANIPYFYWVKAKNATEESDFSASDTGYRNGPNPTNCDGAAVGDGSIATAEIYHDSTVLDYRNPLGNIAPDASAILQLRVCHNDAQRVRVWVWKTGDPLNTPSNKYEATVGSIVGGYDFWEFAVPGPGAVIDQWYQFEVIDGSRSGFYRVAGTNNSGPGVWSDTLTDRSWKLGTTNGGGGTTDYYVPDWMKDAIIYQIFPDRFRNGNAANDVLLTNRTVYGPTTCANGVCQPYLTSWNNAVIQDPNFGIEFKGGDLEGITQKINAGYFDDLGINVLYLNPVFDASSNHGYDTNDYYNIRPGFGGNAAFEALIDAAQVHNIRVILDGVYNHLGSDSKYMDGYGYNRWPASNGACEAVNPYRSWFTTGGQGSGCTDGWGWKGWYNYETIPELVENDVVKTFFYRGGSPQSPGGVSVNQYWINQGTSGWRYDVAQDITLSWWKDMRPYVKDVALGGDPDVLMLAEVTGGCASGLYQQYLTKDGIDSVMNYCFRDWVRGFANGDAPASFDSSWNGYRQAIPPSPWSIQMNLISSHDSPRLLSQLGDNKQRLKLAVILQMTVPGAPSVYYGDEVGMSGTGDPSNRNAYPWADTGGTPDTDMYAHFKKMITMRRDHSALRRGDMATLTTSGVYAYVRWDNSEVILVVLNNTDAVQNVTVPVNSYLPESTVLTDLLNGGTSTISGGGVAVSVPAKWGKVLYAANSNVAPAIPTGVSASDGSFGDKVVVTWSVSSGATAYRVYRATGTLETKIPLGTTTLTTYNDLSAASGEMYFYWVKALNATQESDFSAPDSGYRQAEVAPLAPTNVQASDSVWMDHVQVSWDAVAGVTGYEIYRADSLGATKTLLATITGVIYDDDAVTANRTYYYWVKSKKNSLTSDFSAPDTGNAIILSVYLPEICY